MQGRRTKPFPVAGSARFLIIRSGGENVLNIPVQLEPGKLNLIRR